MRIRAAQFVPEPRAVQRNVERASELLRDSEEFDLLVFPELFLSGYQLDGLDALAVSASDPLFDPLRVAAAEARTSLIIGFAERVDDGVANSALCVDADGSLAGIYRKTHLFGAEVVAFRAGDQIQPMQVGGRTIGIMVCFDLEFPEVARTLVCRGAEMLVTLSANMDPYAVHHAVFARSRALENAVSHVYVNRPGKESGFQFVGESLAVDGQGRLLGGMSHAPGVLDVVVPVGSRPEGVSNYLAERRPELYA